ncbi:MAG: recombinase family protein [Anaerolineae bacterium]|nr:recombinase family protein [Anaerolineae bacterium]
MSEIVLSPGWATYLRVSDEDKQTPERSFAMQRKRISQQLLESSKVQFGREYFDILTGTNSNRKDYQQMLSDAEAGEFSHLGLYRADRFGRDAVEGLQAATKLISLGIKLRVANMPSLMPETPDGFFMFLLQMGLAQREVDVLRERTRDGMEAKLRAGGWPQKAPDGYLNKERLVSSNKYDRWVEIDQDFSPVIRQAWDMLLTNRYTLKQICDELAGRGYTRASGRPWAWDTPKSGRRQWAENRLHKIFHNPFYAGWVVSKRFNIKMGEVRGKWEPIVSTEEFHQGRDILHQHDNHKSRPRRHHYLLRGILWSRVGKKENKLYGSTPTGRSQSYSYYVTKSKVLERQVHIPCEVVDSQITTWISGISIEPELVPKIRELYISELKEASTGKREKQLTELNRQQSQLKDEETRLGRLFISGKIGDDAYNRLRKEWKEKLLNLEIKLSEVKKDASVHIDDLDLALTLLANVQELYPRLDNKQKSTLLQILANRIIVDRDGEFLDIELNSPFTYLQSLVDRHIIRKGGSEQLREGAQKTSLGGVFLYGRRGVIT